ncbi:hypothetical protein GQ53DRAFT_845227 [Thozetella sp. PMI_491]|nr:hypothetical protein GQ53DRAFT_845227 [Thozetella sp. PMI_491]
MASILKGVFGSAPKREPAMLVPTDEVVRMHMLDDLGGYQGCPVAWTCRFDEVLDANKLKQSLWQLLELDGWRKMGGRLHKTDSGKHEIRIPRQFTAERPPLRFSHANEEMRMSEHPLASKLPQATGKLETYPSPRYFRSLSVGPGSPDKFEDYLQGDEPQIALRVVNFADGTLVSLSFLHTVTDMMGFTSFIKAWCLSLAGKLDQVPPFLGFHDDPMAKLYNAEEPSTPYLLADRQISGWRLTAWGLRFMAEAWWSPQLESRTICIPEELVLALRKKANNDLAKSFGQREGGIPFVSDGDIITALATRMACEELTGFSERSVTTVLGVDSRTRAPSVFREDAAYVQNAAVGAFSFGMASEILKAPLGHLALKYRNDLFAQLQLDQVIGLCRLNHQSLQTTGQAVMFGDTSSVLAVVSNWSKSRCFDNVDFSPAIVAPSGETAPASSSEERGAKPGHPVHWQLQPVTASRFSPTLFAVVGQDPKGNLWLTGDMLPSTWPIFEKYLNKVLLEGKSGAEDPRADAATQRPAKAELGKTTVQGIRAKL